MKTQYKEINTLLKWIEDHNKQIELNRINKENNKVYSDAMRSLGVMVFFNGVKE